MEIHQALLIDVSTMGDCFLVVKSSKIVSTRDSYPPSTSMA